MLSNPIEYPIYTQLYWCAGNIGGFFDCSPSSSSKYKIYANIFLAFFAGKPTAAAQACPSALPRRIRGLAAPTPHPAMTSPISNSNPNSNKTSFEKRSHTSICPVLGLSFISGGKGFNVHAFYNSLGIFSNGKWGFIHRDFKRGRSCCVCICSKCFKHQRTGGIKKRSPPLLPFACAAAFCCATIRAISRGSKPRVSEILKGVGNVSNGRRWTTVWPVFSVLRFCWCMTS